MREQSVHEAAEHLSKVSAEAGPKGVLNALAACMPIAGGTFGTMLVNGPIHSLTSHAVHLPSDMFDSWMSTPPSDFGRMMAPLVHGPVGGLFTDRRELTGRFREQLDVFRCVRAAGLGETAGYKVGSRPTVSGAREILFMTLALDGGATFRPEHHDALAALQPAIEAAVRRLHVPLLSSQSILAQLLEEQAIGYACISNKGVVVEANERAYLLALRYARAASVAEGRNTLKDLASTLREGTKAQRTFWLGGGGAQDRLELSAHRLAKETHAIPEDLMLLVMREVPPPSRPESLPLERLTKRRREVALLLATTSLQYKEIADKLGISKETIRTHVEHVYRQLGVHSRGELMMRWNNIGWS